MLACDLRGFGQSDWSGNGVYGYYDYLADIDALVDSLVARGELVQIDQELGIRILQVLI